MAKRSRLKQLVRATVRRIRTRLRLWVAGDMPGEGNKIAHFNDIKRLVGALDGLEAWGYTHKPVIAKKGVITRRDASANAKKIKYCNDNGVTINLSANSPAHADELVDLNIGPVCTTLPGDVSRSTRTPAGRTIRVCPAAVSDSINCVNCGGLRGKGALCYRSDRDYVIGFPAHGFRAKRVTEISSD